MKKIIAISLMALMLFAMAIPMFAAWEIEVDNGKVAFEVKKSDMDIKLDGDLSEYDMHGIELKPTWMSYATSTDDDLAVAKALDPTLYMAWDDTYLYIATSYKPATFSNTKDDAPGNIWQEAAIQVNVSTADATGTDRLEYGNALSSSTGKLISNVWANREGFDYKADGNFIVKNDGGTLIYETRIAWTDFLKAAPKQGDQIGFCLVWAAGVDTAHIHKQLASGCTGNGKTAENFATVTLGAAPERPIEIIEEAPAPAETAPATTAPATTTTPKAAQTSDMGIIIAISTLLTSGAALIVSKKRK